MSDKAIEILIKLRDEASAAMGKIGNASKKAAGEIKVTEKGLKDLAGAAGMGGAAEKVGKVGSAIAELGPLGAVAAAGVATIGAELALLYGGITVISELAKLMDDAARQADILAPKLNLIANTPIVTAESLAAANAYEAQMGTLTTVTSGFSQVLVDAYAPDMERASAVTTGLSLALLDIVNAIEKVGAKRGIIDDITNQLIGMVGATALGGGVFGAIAAPLAGKALGAAAGSGTADDFAAQGMAAKLKLEAQARSDAARKAAADAKTPKAAKTISGGKPSAAQTFAVSGPSSKGMDQIDVSDIVGPGLVELTRDVSAWAVEIDLSSEYATDAADSMTALNTTMVETSKAAKAAKLNSIAGGLGTAQSIISSGTAGIANAVSATGPVGVVVGAVMSLGDTLATMGTEGLHAMIDGVLGIPVTVLEMLPSILTEMIPSILTEGIPTLVSGIILALPDIVIALAQLVPLLVESLIKMAINMTKDLIVGFKEALNPFDGKSKANKDGFQSFQYADNWKILMGKIGVKGKGGGDAYVDPSTGPRSGGGSTARTSGPDGGGSEQHVHVHVGTHVGTDAKSARELARMLRSHMGTRGTGLALE